MERKLIRLFAKKSKKSNQLSYETLLPHSEESSMVATAYALMRIKNLKCEYEWRDEVYLMLSFWY